MAQGGSELHHRLVVISGAIWIDQGLGDGLELFLSGGSILEFLMDREDAG